MCVCACVGGCVWLQVESGEGVFFIYPEHAFTEDQLPQAREHTDFLVAHLEEVRTDPLKG